MTRKSETVHLIVHIDPCHYDGGWEWALHKKVGPGQLLTIDRNIADTKWGVRRQVARALKKWLRKESMK